MVKKDQFSILDITEGYKDCLSISRDYEEDENKIFPVFLFTPDAAYPDEHYHVSLTREQAEALRNWLNAYLMTTTL